MALHNQVRLPIAFDNATLITQIGDPAKTRAASVLLRTVALVALTHKEHHDVATPTELKVAPAYDCLFVFSNNGEVFPDRKNDDIDLIIATNELNLIGPLSKTPDDFKGYMAMNPANRALAAWPANVPTADEAITPQFIFNDYSNNVVGPANPNITFFDEVNAIHNVHKKIARYYISIEQEILPLFKVNITYPGPAITMPIQRTGNLEGTKVENWGAYSGNAEERDAFINLRNNFRAVHAGGAAVILTPKAFILRDLYRLECIREPATIIANAMFLDLATSGPDGYQGINSRYNFHSLTTRMPMAINGAVGTTRRLWRDTILTHAINNPIYYRYDYPSLLGVPLGNLEALARLENNLLFNYIMWKADLAGGNITNVLRTVVGRATQAQQDNDLTTGANPWVFFVLAAHYTKDVAININGINYNIMFRVTLPPGAGALINNTCVSIVSFPLALINQLLLEWYNVDIGLPNQQIQIDLQLG